MKHLDFDLLIFGTRGSEVQILSPRPLFLFERFAVQIEKYIDSMLVLRQGSTANRAAQILFEYLPFATEPPKDGIIAYLADCKLRGNTNRTLSNKLVRVKAFYASQFDLKITRKDVPRPTYVERVPEIYSPDGSGSVLCCL